jgi:Lysine methyltransferase
MCVSHNLPQAKMVLCTEQRSGGALPWLRENVATNSHLQLGSLHTAICDWSDFDVKACTRQQEEAQEQSLQRTPDESPSACASGAMGSSHVAHTQRGSPGRVQIGRACQFEVAHSSAEHPAHDGEVTPRDAGEWNFILGSDLIYNEEVVRQLPRVLAALAGERTCILYAHTKKRFEHLDIDFLEQLQSVGLQWREVREAWAASPPPSPEPFESLFPEMRIAVYHIYKVANASDGAPSCE